MGNARRFTGWVLAIVCAADVCAAQPALQIQFAERVELPSRAGHVEFDAYGRRFAMDLESNDRLLAAIPAARKAQLDRAQLMRGKLAGVAGSWVRIARVGDGLEGAIWDGRDLYVVTNAGAIASALIAPLTAAPSDTVVFRLSDAINGLPKGFCGVAPDAARSASTEVTALSQYKAIVAEIRAVSATTDQLDVALIADGAFQSFAGANTSEVMLARLNTVDGIFFEQVGVLLVPNEVRLVPPGNDPFTQTEAGELLRQLSDYRQANPSIRAAGLAHLVTGKDLDGNTIGVAYLDSLCDQPRGVSLSSNGQVIPFYSALIMAHEFGHNFGAEHDSEPGSACAATPANYLMAPTINGSSTFSQCSRNMMAASIARARGSCIVSESYADLALDAPTTTVLADAGGRFSLPLTVRSIGTLAASGTRLRVSLSTGLGFVSGTVAGGACSAVGSEVTCTIGDIASGEQRDIDVQLSSDYIGSHNASVSVIATNDFITANNSATVPIYTRSGVDLGVAITVTPDEVYIGEPIDFNVDVSALRTQAARGGTLRIDPRGISIQSIDAGGNSCAPVSPGSNLVQCQLADLNAGTQTRIVVHGLATSPAALTATASIILSQDSNSANDSATASYTIFAERDVVLTGSSSNLRAVIGVPFDITYTLTTRGRLPAETVWLQVIGPIGALQESVVPSAGACVQQNVSIYRCDFGTLNPGDVRTVVATYRTTENGNSGAIGVLRYQDGAQQRSARHDTYIYSNLRVDAVALVGTMPNTVPEGELGGGSFRVETRGVDLAQNVVATFEVPASVRLTHVIADQTTDPWQCELETAQRGRCTGSFVAATNLWGSFNFESDIPGEYEGTLTISATDDGDASNNVVRMPIRIERFLDPGLTGPTQRRNFLVGQTEDITFTVTTGRNPVPGVAIRASTSPNYYNWETMSINGVVCQNNGSPFQECALGDLPANASVPVTLRYQFLRSGYTGSVGATVTTARDHDYSNNSASFPFSIMSLTDVQLSIAQTTATAVNGSRLQFPNITVRPGTGAANDVIVTVPLPPFATIEVASGNAVCSGTTTLECSMAFIAPGGLLSLDISLNTIATGTFTSNISVRSANDSNADNNTMAVTLSVTEPPPPPPPPTPQPPAPQSPSSSSGGGGGSFEWLALVFLALIAACRCRAGHRWHPG